LENEKNFLKIEEKSSTCLFNYKISCLKIEPISKYFKDQDKDNICQFTDSYFKPEKNNIHYIDSAFEKRKRISPEEKEYLASLKFKCLFQLYQKNSLQIPKNFHISISAAEFKGGVGNPNLISCLLFLYWIYPKFCFSMLQFNLECKSFYVTLFVQGQPKKILIDSFIPVKVDIDQKVNSKYKREFGFISTSEVNYWILIIEKALAKISKSYGNTIRYYASEIYPLLSDIPMIKIENSEKTKLKVWSLLFKASKKTGLYFLN